MGGGGVGARGGGRGHGAVHSGQAGQVAAGLDLAAAEFPSQLRSFRTVEMAGEHAAGSRTQRNTKEHTERKRLQQKVKSREDKRAPENRWTVLLSFRPVLWCVPVRCVRTRGQNLGDEGFAFLAEALAFNNVSICGDLPSLQ